AARVSGHDPPPGTLERSDRLLDRIFLDVFDDLADRGGLATRRRPRRRVRHGAWFYHAERNRTTATASSSAVANTASLACSVGASSIRCRSAGPSGASEPRWYSARCGSSAISVSGGGAISPSART